MTRSVQLEYLEKLEKADIDGVGPKFEEAVLSAAVRYAKLPDLVPLLNMNGLQKANVSLLEPTFAQNNLDEVRLCQLAMKALVLERLVPLVGKGEESKSEVLGLAKALREVAEASAAPGVSLVRKAFLSDLDLIACTILGVLGEPVHRLNAEESLQKVTSLVKDSGKEGYKFVFRKALEQDVFWRGEVAKYMEAAVAAATLLPDVEKLSKKLAKSLHSSNADEIRTTLCEITTRLPIFRTSLPSHHLVDLEEALGQAFWVLLGDKDLANDEKKLASAREVIAEYLKLPMVEGGADNAAITQAKAAESHCQEMLQQLQLSSVEQAVVSTLDTFKAGKVGLDAWEALSKQLMGAEMLTAAAKEALANNAKHLVQALSSELLSEFKPDVLSAASQTLKQVAPLVPDEDGAVLREVAKHSLAYQELQKARTPLQNAEKVFEKREQRDMRVAAGVLVQKLEKCQSLAPQQDNVALFCKSVERIVVQAEKTLKELKDVFKENYEKTLSTSVDVAAPLVSSRNEWKDNLMGSQDTVPWKVLLKAGGPLVDPKGEHATLIVEILHAYSEFSKDRCIPEQSVSLDLLMCGIVKHSYSNVVSYCDYATS